MHSAEEVADWFLAWSYVHDDGVITKMSIQKLLYYAQAHSLMTLSEPLFKDPIEAWEHGPVVRSIYRKYKNQEENEITLNNDFDFSSFQDSESQLLLNVWVTFRDKTPSQLRNMTHDESPWIKAWDRESYRVVTQTEIKDFYEKVYNDYIVKKLLEGNAVR